MVPARVEPLSPIPPATDSWYVTQTGPQQQSAWFCPCPKHAAGPVLPLPASPDPSHCGPSEQAGEAREPWPTYPPKQPVELFSRAVLGIVAWVLSPSAFWPDPPLLGWWNPDLCLWLCCCLLHGGPKRLKSPELWLFLKEGWKKGPLEVSALPVWAGTYLLTSPVAPSRLLCNTMFV